MAATTKSPIKLVGDIAWVPEEKIQGPVSVKRAIFRPPNESLSTVFLGAQTTMSNLITLALTDLKEFGVLKTTQIKPVADFTRAGKDMF